MPRYGCLAAWAIVAVVVASGCGGGGGAPIAPAAPLRSAVTQCGPFQIQLQADRSVYAEGQPVRLTLTATNTSGAPATIHDPTPGAAYIFIDRGEFPAWQWPAYSSTATFGDIVVGPGQTHTFTQVWNQRYATDTDPGSISLAVGGTYTATALLPDFPYPRSRSYGAIGLPPCSLPTVTFTIQAPCAGERMDIVPAQVVVGTKSGVDVNTLVARWATLGAATLIDQDAGYGGVVTLQLRTGVCVDEAIAELQREPGVRYAETNGLGGVN